MQNEERINGLETQVRTLKKIVYGFGCLLVAGVVVSATSLQTVPDVIQAKKFEVMNDEGKAVVELSSFNENGVINTKDSLGNLIFVVLSQKDPNGINSGTVTTLNEKAQKLVQLGVTTGGTGSVTIENGKGQKIVQLSASDDGGKVVTGNNKGEVTSQLPNPKTSD